MIALRCNRSMKFKRVGACVFDNQRIGIVTRNFYSHCSRSSAGGRLSLRLSSRGHICFGYVNHGFASFSLRQNAEHLGIQLVTPASHRSRTMKEAEGQVLGNRIFTKQIRALGKEGKWDEACDVFKGVHVRDTIIYSTLLAAALWCDRYSEGLQIFEQMIKEGVKPTSVTYVTVMNLHCRLGESDEVKNLFQEIVKLERKPPPLAFMPLLTCAADTGNIIAVEEIFSEMDTFGVIPDRGHLGVKLRACRAAKDPSRALAVLGEMRTRGIEPCLRSYTMALGALRASDPDLEDALHWISNLLADMSAAGIRRNEYFLEEHVGTLLGQSFHEIETNAIPISKQAAEAALQALQEGARDGVNSTKGLRATHAALQRQLFVESDSSGPQLLSTAVGSSALPHPWTEHWSEEHRRPYFRNEITQQSVWERPVS